MFTILQEHTLHWVFKLNLYIAVVIDIAIKLLETRLT